MAERAAATAERVIPQPGNDPHQVHGHGNHNLLVKTQQFYGESQSMIFFDIVY